MEKILSFINEIALESGWRAGIWVLDADNYVRPDDTARIECIYKAGWF